jgi:hypothetical protein
MFSWWMAAWCFVDVLAWAPKELEKDLGLLILEPVKSHIHGLGCLCLWLDFTIYNTICC